MPSVWKRRKALGRTQIVVMHFERSQKPTPGSSNELAPPPAGAFVAGVDEGYGIFGVGVKTGVSTVGSGASTGTALDEGCVVSGAGDADKAGVLVFVPPSVSGTAAGLLLAAGIAPIPSFGSKANGNTAESDAIDSGLVSC